MRFTRCNALWQSLTRSLPLAVLTVSASAVGAAETPRPNFVILLADDLGYGDLGCYGNDQIPTPRLDELAAQGLRFTDFHASGPVCSPTRAGLLTGRYQQRAGIPGVILAGFDQNRHHGLQPTEVTFAELLHGAGYATGVMGKWHLGYERAYNPTRQGFDEFHGYVSGNIDYHSHFDRMGVLDWWEGTEVADEPGYSTHRITRHAVEFIDANAARPFCLYVAYEAPHDPYQGPNDPAQRVAGEVTPLNYAAGQVERAYREMVEEMDKGIGEIIARLRRHGLETNTFVFFFSDNGATRRGSNGPLRGFKGSLWEGGHREPAIAWWPGRIVPGQTSAETAISLDVMPTLLELAGVPAPKERPLDGRSLVPLLLRNEHLPDRPLFWEYGNQQAMREGPWKLLVQGSGTSGQEDAREQVHLFNLEDDLGETRDLAAGSPQRTQAMREALQDWRTEVHKGATLQPEHASGTQSVDGYRGIWFTLGQRSEYGDKYSGGLGTYTAKHVPTAIYSPQAGHTFFVYGGAKDDQRHLLAMIGKYDSIITGLESQPTIVHDKLGVNDPHDNPSLSMDDSGRLWVFVSGRGRHRPGFIYRGEQPYEINRFERVLEWEMTYPQPWPQPDSGFLLLFTRYTKGRELYWSRSRNGFDWPEPQKLAGMGGHYQVSNRRGDRVITAFNRHPGGNVDQRTDLFFAQTWDGGATWGSVDGQLLQTPLTNPDTPALVRAFSAENRLVYLKDINFDAHGRPMILVITSADHRPGPVGDPRIWTVAHWDDRAWRFSEVTRSTHNYDMGSLYVEPDGAWRIIGPTEPGPQHWGAGGEMALWESRDEGDSWRKLRNITHDSQFNHNYARRPVNASPEFYAFWADGNPDSFSNSRLYYYNLSSDRGTQMLARFGLPTETRVLCLGDSITANGGWVDELDESDQFEIINAGLGGRRASQAAEALTKAIADHPEAERLVLFLGVNDLPARDPRPGEVKVAEVVRNMESTLDLALTRFRREDILLIAPCNVNPDTLSEVNLAKGYQVTPPLLADLEREYRLLALTKGVWFLSLLHVVSPENYRDGLHPNAAGDTQIADAIGDFLADH
ncbi:MAG: sulfatase-like hydrolase/transferase [Verrucomicrobiales bacterium]|nr:sulfatase-like hydrolase/transferase [Verrucomicrobiales bacterium]